MSAKTEIKGIITHTEAPKQTRNNWVMNIVVEKPPYTDEYGTTRGKPNHYQIAIFKANKEDMPKRADLLKKKVKADVYVSGREYPTDNGMAYSTNLIMNQYELIK